MIIKGCFKMYAVFAVLISFSVQAQQVEHTITVQGVGEVVVDNSQGSVNASVTTKNLDANQALMANNTIVNNMIGELNGVGINSGDITTNQFYFQPDYHWENNSYAFRGYTVTNGIDIQVNEISAIGSILNLLVDAGATKINSVSFGSTELTAIKQQALVKATEDARLKAEIIAQATGVTLGNVIRVNLSASSYMAPSTENESGLVSSVPISPGKNTIREHVSVSYLIVD